MADAVQHRVRRDLLGDLLDELEDEYGPADAAGVREAMKEWPEGGGGAVGRLVLNAEGLVKLSGGDARMLERVQAAWRRGGELLTAASTLAEVLRGGPGEAKLHRVLRRVPVLPVDGTVGRAAGELLGQAGLSGQRCTSDALLAAVALGQPRPVLLLTSDPEDMRRLTGDPGRPPAERIAVVRS